MSLEAAHQHARGDHLDTRVRADGALAAHREPDRFPHTLTQQGGNSSGGSARSHTSRLRADHRAADARCDSGRNERRLTGPGGG